MKHLSHLPNMCKVAEPNQSLNFKDPCEDGCYFWEYQHVL